MACSSSTMNSGTTATTSQTKEVIVASWCASNSVGGVANPTNSFTLRTNNDSTVDVTTADRIVSATGAYSSVVTFAGTTPSSWASAGVIISLKDAEGDAAGARMKVINII